MVEMSLYFFGPVNWSMKKERVCPTRRSDRVSLSNATRVDFALELKNFEQARTKHLKIFYSVWFQVKKVVFGFGFFFLRHVYLETQLIRQFL